MNKNKPQRATRPTMATSTQFKGSQKSGDSVSSQQLFLDFYNKMVVVRSLLRNKLILSCKDVFESVKDSDIILDLEHAICKFIEHAEVTAGDMSAEAWLLWNNLVRPRIEKELGL